MTTDPVSATRRWQFVRGRVGGVTAGVTSLGLVAVEDGAARMPAGVTAGRGVVVPEPA